MIIPMYLKLQRFLLHVDQVHPCDHHDVSHYSRQQQYAFLFIITFKEYFIAIKATESNTAKLSYWYEGQWLSNEVSHFEGAHEQSSIET